MSRFFQYSRWLAALVLLAGCDPKTYRAETVLHGDGSISRAVYQPASETPDEARESAAWEVKTYAPRVPHDEWNDTIRSLPAATQDKDRPYFAAWGKFSATDQLPQTFRKAAPDGLPDGTLQLDYEREDLVLVVEHRWRETLTDVVTLDDMHRARRELVDLVIPLIEKTLKRGLGDDYDTTALVDWLHTTGTSLFFEMTDVLFDVGARGELDDSKKLFAALEPVISRYGLSLGDDTGKVIDGDAVQAALAEYVRGVLKETIRRRDGQPVRPEVIDEIMQSIGIMDVPAGFEKSTRYEEAAKHVLAESHGSEEAFGLVIKPLVHRILGLYRGDLLAAPRRFVYLLETPGVIVETSGELLSENRTQFEFSDAQAYPLGFSMSCRSLDLIRYETGFPVAGVFADRTHLFAYVDLVRGNESLLEVMRKCVSAGNIGPLQQARDASAPDSPDMAKYDALLAMLQSAPKSGD